MKLRIDIETYCELDITDVGAHKYVSHPSFQVILLGYAFDDDPVEVIDLLTGTYQANDFIALASNKQKYNDAELEFVMDGLRNRAITKTAFNAQFERLALNAQYPIYTQPENWSCTMVKSLIAGFPGSLEDSAKALRLKENKDKRGKQLINMFCKPQKPSASNGYVTRIYPHMRPQEWQEFIEYCRQDVVVEREIDKRLDGFELTPFERELWCVDQRINDRGIMLDRSLITGAMAIYDKHKSDLYIRAKLLTHLDNPFSLTQLKKWVNNRIGWDLGSLDKDSRSQILGGARWAADFPDDCVEAIRYVDLASKTSVKKFHKMHAMINNDDCARGLLQYAGANRTWRWAGRGIQVQNLAKNKMSLSKLDIVRDVVKQNDLGTLKFMHENVLDALSQLIRTAFVARPGNRFIVSDFSAIEARVLAWYCNEVWRMQVFATHGKIYEASAHQMFNVPMEEITKTSPWRQRGKTAELGLGYQGGTGALITMGALDNGLKEDELPGLVEMWRKANPNIVQTWYDTQRCAIRAVEYQTTVEGYKGVTFTGARGCLFVKLPSGRFLTYPGARVDIDYKYNRPALSYMGLDQENKQWRRISTYGGKLIENLIQAIARDCLAWSIVNLEREHYNIVMHIHDEVVIDEPLEINGGRSQKQVTDIMDQNIPWAPGLLLKADAYETPYYLKD